MSYDYMLMPSPVGQLTLVARHDSSVPFCGKPNAPIGFDSASYALLTTTRCCWKPSVS